MEPPLPQLLMRVGVKLALSYAMATIGCVVGMLIWTANWETIGAGLLVPLFLMPSLSAYLLLEVWRPGRRYRHLGFLLPAVGFEGFMLQVVWTDAPGPVSDGAPEMAMCIAVSVFSGAVVSYLACLKLRSYTACRTTNGR